MGIRDELAAQGYFELPPRLPPALIARARDDIERVTARGAPAVAAFLYDPMWELRDEILPIAREALDDAEVATLPAFWAWRVGPGDLGWGPHRDNPGRARTADGALCAITIWIPLADATPRNGCIHCVPSNWDYEYENPDSRCGVTHQQYLRALPAAAGAVLGWSHALLHWGGACAPDAPPRLATSFELIRADHAQLVPRTYAAGWRPARAERIAILDEVLAKYQHMNPTGERARAAIDALIEELPR